MSKRKKNLKEGFGPEDDEVCDLVSAARDYFGDGAEDVDDETLGEQMYDERLKAMENDDE